MHRVPVARLCWPGLAWGRPPGLRAPPPRRPGRDTGAVPGGTDGWAAVSDRRLRKVRTVGRQSRRGRPSRCVAVTPSCLPFAPFASSQSSRLESISSSTNTRSEPSQPRPRTAAPHAHDTTDTLLEASFVSATRQAPSPSRESQPTSVRSATASAARNHHQNQSRPPDDSVIYLRYALRSTIANTLRERLARTPLRAYTQQRHPSTTL